jgi:hypothetical protein
VDRVDLGMWETQPEIGEGGGWDPEKPPGWGGASGGGEPEWKRGLGGVGRIRMEGGDGKGGPGYRDQLTGGEDVQVGVGLSPGI